MPNKKIRYAIQAALIVLVFIVVSYVAQNNIEFFREYIRYSLFSMLLYVFILIVSAVVAPFDVVFLIPVASSVWGWVLAALLSLFGWTLGSAVVFVLCRKYGVHLIKKFVPLEKIHKYEKLMPERNIFLAIVLLRLALPIDIVTYSIGLLTKVKFLPFIFATLIGFAPLAFFLAYLGTFPAYMQVAGFVFLLLVVIIGFLSVKHVKEKRAVRF